MKAVTIIPLSSWTADKIQQHH